MYVLDLLFEKTKIRINELKLQQAITTDKTELIRIEAKLEEYQLVSDTLRQYMKGNK